MVSEHVHYNSSLQKRKCSLCGKVLEPSEIKKKLTLCENCRIKSALDDIGLPDGSSIREAILNCICTGSIS